MFDFLIQHQLWILLLVLAALSTAACAAHYKPHPGALDVTDSAAYDTLLVAEAAIDQRARRTKRARSRFRRKKR
jgi:hypothetical protein